ncbi:MAG: LysM peptidoglycan-binding domain-containing protein [Lentisphaeria bacterium]|nr:LysM peptidoglycan-binding domain-containing protein [Lentisphaeria bacterium]
MKIEARIGILGMAAVSAAVILSGCKGPTIMENREGVPSAVRELGFQKDTAIPGGTMQESVYAPTAFENNSADSFADNSIAENTPASVDNNNAAKNDSAEVEFPRMEDMSKKTVGPKVESKTTKVTASGEYYVVAKGDSIGSIAKKFKVKKSALIAVNNITNPNLIRTGQKLKLPKGAQVSARGNNNNNTPNATVVSSDLVVNGLYIVKPNDSISRIAKKLKITRASLMQANNLNENSILHPGQKLVVPNAKGAEVNVVDTNTTTPATPAEQGGSGADIEELIKELNDETVKNTETASTVANEGEAVVQEAKEAAEDAVETVPTQVETTVTDAVEAEDSSAVITTTEDITVAELCKKHNLNLAETKLMNSYASDDTVIPAGKTVIVVRNK